MTCRHDAEDSSKKLDAIRYEDGKLPAYAWPGGYAVAYVVDDGELLCAACVNGEESVHFDGDADGWRVDRPARSIKPVVGRHSDDALCNAACTGAVGPDCECQCGGMNHARALTGGRG